MSHTEARGQARRRSNQACGPAKGEWKVKGWSRIEQESSASRINLQDLAGPLLDLPAGAGAPPPRWKSAGAIIAGTSATAARALLSRPALLFDRDDLVNGL
jgi:hypothetical protein